MKWLTKRFASLKRRYAMTDEQAERLASIKFPCC